MKGLTPINFEFCPPLPRMGYNHHCSNHHYHHHWRLQYTTTTTNLSHAAPFPSTYKNQIILQTSLTVGYHIMDVNYDVMFFKLFNSTNTKTTLNENSQNLACLKTILSIFVAVYTCLQDTLMNRMITCQKCILR